MVQWLARWTFDLEVRGSSLVSAIMLNFKFSLDKRLFSTFSLFTQGHPGVECWFDILFTVVLCVIILQVCSNLGFQGCLPRHVWRVYD